MGPGLTFVIEAKPYLNAVLMPLGLKHRAVARKIAFPLPNTIQGVLGTDLDNIKAMQQRIEDFTNHMSELLRIKRDAELEFTQEELDVFPRPLDDASDPSKPIEFLVNHSQPQQELCDTICNLTTISTSTAVPLSIDHKPDKSDERQRIEDAGGFISWAGT
ncbi:putative protein phosphatase 2C [Arachis hypogaea]|nr:putative protein phosphatase 2C [Arachis hypogaea]